VRNQKVVKDLPERSLEQDIVDLRERVVRLEVQLTEVTRRVDSLTSYTRQLFEYLNKSQ
jgi:hypothetical protein